MRRAARRRVVAASAAAVVALVVAQSVDRAEHERQAWGATRRVVVASRRLSAGHVLSDGDVRTVELPAAAVPDAALEEGPTGMRTTSEVAAGEVLTSPRVARRRGGEVSAVLPENRVAVAVEVSPAGAPVAPGDHVDLWAQEADPVDGLLGPARRVARGAVVLRAGTGADADAPLVVAVTGDEAGDVAGASLTGTVAVVVVP